jgi:hypothetical protein
MELVFLLIEVVALIARVGWVSTETESEFLLSPGVVGGASDVDRAGVSRHRRGHSHLGSGHNSQNVTVRVLIRTFLSIALQLELEGRWFGEAPPEKA